MQSFIITVPAAFFCAQSDVTLHYKSNETVNLWRLRCATTLPITVFCKLCFLHSYMLFLYLCTRKLHACNIRQPTRTEWWPFKLLSY